MVMTVQEVDILHTLNPVGVLREGCCGKKSRKNDKFNYLWFSISSPMLDNLMSDVDCFTFREFNYPFRGFP